MNGLRRITFYRCAKTGADDENRKAGRSTLTRNAFDDPESKQMNIA